MFTAKWNFNCARCDELHSEGTPAQFNRNNEIEAIDCASAKNVDDAPKVMPRGTTHADRCDKCFMVHSPGQKGCE